MLMLNLNKMNKKGSVPVTLVVILSFAIFIAALFSFVIAETKLVNKTNELRLEANRLNLEKSGNAFLKSNLGIEKEIKARESYTKLFFNIENSFIGKKILVYSLKIMG